MHHEHREEYETVSGVTLVSADRAQGNVIGF